MKKILAAFFLAVMLSPAMADYTQSEWVNVELDGNFYDADC